MSTQKRVRPEGIAAAVNNQTSNPARQLAEEFESRAENVRQDFLTVFEMEMPDDVRGVLYITLGRVKLLIKCGSELADGTPRGSAAAKSPDTAAPVKNETEICRRQFQGQTAFIMGIMDWEIEQWGEAEKPGTLEDVKGRLRYIKQQVELLAEMGEGAMKPAPATERAPARIGGAR